jgi:hypothetical protein
MQTMQSPITERADSQRKVLSGRRQPSNQFGMNHYSIKITINGVAVYGTLMLSDEVWAFGSDDAAFLSVFPTGMTYSFSQFGPGDTYYSIWQHAIAAEAEALKSIAV